MKKISLIFVLAFIAILAKADPIGYEEARQKASEFLAQRGHSIALVGKTAFKAPRQGASEDAYLYIFNAENNGGFVVISGDTNTDTILGYADSGSMDEASMPAHIRNFLIGLAEEVRVAGELNKERRSAPRRSAQTAKKYIEPLLKTKWNQGNPYNLLCPTWYNSDGTPGNLCATGCVATAIAQVINYYKYPDKTAKSIPSHTLNPGDGPVSVTLPTIRKGTAIDWEHMCDTYDSNNTEEENMAVAKLMLMCGQGVKMGYGPSSGAALGNCVTLTHDYLGFDDSVHGEDRNNFDADTWCDRMYEEIASGHPICYQGFSTGGGHAFVLDGFDGDQLFHVNWGWGGSCDGWFKIAILNPGDNSGIGASATADGYSVWQVAIMGVRLPDDVASPNRSQFTIRDQEIVDGSKIKCTVINWSGTSGDFNVSLCTFDSDGSLKPFGIVNNISLNYCYLTSTEFSIPQVANGTYKLVIGSKLSSATTYFTTMEPWREYFLLEVTGRGQYTLTHYKNPVDLEITDWNITTNLVVNQSQNVQTVFHNNGGEFYGELFFFASTDKDNKGERVGRTELVIKPDYDEDIVFNFKPTETGTYHLWVCYDEQGTQVIDHTTVEVTETAISNESLRVEKVAYNALYGDFVSGTLTISNLSAEPVSTSIIANLWISWSNNGWYNVYQAKEYPVEIAANQQTTITFYYDNCLTDYDYAMNFSYTSKNEDLDRGGLSHVSHLNKGIITYKSDGSKTGTKVSTSIRVAKDAVAVDMRNQSTITKGSASEDSQCLYFVDADYELPAFLENCCVVQDGQCSDINLTPEWGFLSIDKFTASSISYSYTLPEENAGAWQTIAIPFTPDEITIDGKAVTWRKNDTDYAGAFWMKRFDGISEEGTVCFNYFEEFDPQIPYIIAGSNELAGKTIVFKATDAEIESTLNKNIISGTSDYSFFGTLMPTTTTAATYVMNETGTAFVPAQENAIVAPYQAYLNCKMPVHLRPASIPLEEAVLGVKEIQNARNMQHKVYTISGVKINSDNLPKGVYIIDGKKTIIK